MLVCFVTIHEKGSEIQMATNDEGSVTPKSIPAGSDLSAAQYLAVDVADASGIAQLAVVGTLGVKGIGILQDKPDAAGRPGAVHTIGSGVVTKWVASAAITSAAKVTSAANGKAVTAGSGHHVYGVALQSAAAVNEVIRVLLVSPHDAP